MRRLDVTARARRDVDGALRRSARDHGQQAAERYRRLIDVALDALRADPLRPGVRAGPKGLHVYPLAFSRDRAPPRERVRKPRHLVVFYATDDLLTVIRFLHDAMDLPKRLGAR